MEAITSVENLRLKFPGTDSLLFKDFSLTIHEGEKVLIIGPSGSGKSTLLQVLTGLIPDSIEVPIKADNIKSPASWGFLFQDPDMQFCMPFVDEEIAFVLENLQVPREKMPEKIHQYLNQVGLTMEDIHTNIQTLSGGMKQRLAIASVLALQPDVLFLDEPTAMLDPGGTEEVWNTIKEVGEDKTLVIVEHNIEQIIDYVNRIILLNSKGEIIADGTSEQIFSQHKKVLREHGIWYPGVWDEYEKYPSKERNKEKEERADMPFLSLSNFSGFRGKQRKIEVGQLNVYPGEWITVVGENGAGKSTLLHALIKLIKTRGDYRVFNHDAHQCKRITDHISFVFQNPEFQFITNKVYDEVAYSLIQENYSQREIETRVHDLLEDYQLSKVKNNHPYHLSMGQKRRLSVASSIVKKQPILLLDEPTFGQDAKNTFAILEQLEEIRKSGSTIIMVTHDMNIVEKFATRVWKISEGKLIEDKPPHELLAHTSINGKLHEGSDKDNAPFRSRDLVTQN